MKNRILRKALCMAALWLFASGFAPLMSPEEGGGAAHPGGDIPVHKSKEAQEERWKTDFNRVVTIDNTTYTNRDLYYYARYLMEETIGDRQDLSEFVDPLVFDVIAYEDAIAEMPDLAEDPWVRSAHRRFLRRLIPDLLEEKVRGEVKYTREDLIRSLPDPKAVYECSFIVCKSQEEALKVRWEVLDGMPFPDAARKYSEGLGVWMKGKSSAAIEEGDYALLTESEFANILPLRDDGALSPVFESRIGWMFVRLDRYISPAERKENEAEKSFPFYRSGKEAEAIRDLGKALKDKAKIVWYDKVFDGFKQVMKAGGSFSEELLRSPLVRVNGEPIFLLELAALASAHGSEELDRNLDRKVAEELALQEGIRQGVESEFKALIETSRRRAVTRRYLQVKSRVSQAEVDTFYRENPEKFTSEEVRRVIAVETEDQAKAKMVLEKAKKGKDPRELASQYNDLSVNREKQGDMGFVVRRQLSADVGDQVFGAREGGVLGPMESTGRDGKKRYAVIFVETIRKPEVIPFDRLDREDAAKKTAAWKTVRIYRELVEKAMKRHEVIHHQTTGKGAGAHGLL